MEKKRKIFYINVDEAEGMDAISLVDSPAVELPFLKFDKDEKVEVLKFDGDKRIITGVVCLADTPIYRYSEKYGEFWVVFTKENIEKMVRKYSKNNLFNSINLQHNDNEFRDGIYMVESYIKDSERGIVPKEFSNIPDGSWLCSFYVEDEKLWNEIKESGELNGFSLQGVFDLKDKVDMSSDKDLIDELIDEL